ncbi:hypothetical protein K458DRAFT_64496 [Lentithecium fluviatile CBS 122367]|uniref:Uncharacterized protein n=1 Tax=Lentithecium fluviatile CBS 122367 TaxID=1168545 RepID=A0A6G1JKH2_9PLEO|nr:hypothetical protein K458DRAFT_64496 [Lentithecium fluviatile CBS 122367]
MVTMAFFIRRAGGMRHWLAFRVDTTAHHAARTERLLSLRTNPNSRHRVRQTFGGGIDGCSTASSTDSASQCRLHPTKQLGYAVSTSQSKTMGLTHVLHSATTRTASETAAWVDSVTSLWSQPRLWRRLILDLLTTCFVGVLVGCGICFCFWNFKSKCRHYLR